jgi:hypothetical protein
MHASTGGPGTWRTPKVASESVIECDSETRHRQQEHSRAAHDEDKRKHEQKVVEAEQDVLDAVQEISAGDRKRPGRAGDLDPRLGRTCDDGPAPAVEHLEAGQHVGDGELQAGELDALSR